MFSSSGPNIPSGDSAILSNYYAALDYLTTRETRSHQFGRQSGWIELLRNGDSFEDGRIGIRYHDTHVIVLHQNGDIELNTGGWFTVSTANWMRCCPKLNVRLYEARGTRKPYRYSMARFCGHDRNIERKLREEWGMPDITDEPYIWDHTFQEWCTTEDGDVVRDENGYCVYYITDPVMHERAQYFQAELRRRQMARHPWYVFEGNRILFSKRGACNAQRLSDAIAKERTERAKQAARRRKTFGQITAYTNRTMKALAEGLPLDTEDCADPTALAAFIERREPSGPLTMRIVQRTLGDPRAWLNTSVRDDGEVVLGPVAPITEPHIRKKIRAALTQELVH